MVIVTFGVMAAFLTPLPPDPHLKPFAHLLSKQVHDAYLVLGIVTLLFLAWRERSQAQAIRVVAVMGTETALFGIIKGITWYGLHLWSRPSGGDGGFPSGHTAASCALAFLLTERFPRLSPVFYVLASLIAWSRVGDGAHYAYQVLAGAMLGFAVAFSLVSRQEKPRNTDSDVETTANRV
jgi:membrane-associated phospholipid phosphatase